MMLLQVDNFGTVNLVEACRKRSVNRFILVSSILVNGAAMGQILNPAYIFLNVFGLTLVAKLQAEQYIRKSGINYTIIRPGGLRNEPPTGNIIMEPEVMAYVVRLKNIFATLSSAKNSVAFLSINYYSSQKKIYSVASLSLCPL
jgi:nucleoside-diphosphate-sugar epimerase